MKPLNDTNYSELSEEEKAKREKIRKRFTLLAGCALLIFAVVLYLQKSDYARNKIALLFGAEDYYVYIEQKNIEATNSLLVNQYNNWMDTVKENDSLHTTKKISASGKVLALAELFLKTKFDTSGSAELYSIRQGDSTGLIGELVIGSETYPLELIYNKQALRILHPTTGEYYGMKLNQSEFSLEQLLENNSVKGKVIQKKLAEYEKLFFTELSQTEVTLTKHVLQSVNSHSAYQDELTVTCQGEQLLSVVNTVLEEVSKDDVLKEIYDAGNQTNFTYEEWIQQVQASLVEEGSFLSEVSSLTMELVLDNSGTITGRDIVIETKKDKYRIGYSSVKNGLSVGVEAYVCVNNIEYFLLDGICEIKNAAVSGDITISFLAGDSVQEYQISLREFGIIDLLQRKLMGDIKITSDLFLGANIQIELQASSEQQECNVYLVYGGTEQMEINILIEDAPLRELPSDYSEEKPIYNILDLWNSL